MESEFKKEKRQKACTSRPWAFLVPKDIRNEILFKVKEECVEIYGRDFEACDKRKICFTKTCMGRELEWKSPTALPYLKEFAKLTGIKENDEYKVITNCQTCPIYKTCTSTCGQVNDWINRASEPETPFIYQENLENYNQEVAQSSGERPKEEGFELPWDILSSQKAKVIKKYLYEQKDFLAVAKELDLNNQAEAKYVFYSALTKLSEYGIMRKFLHENSDKLTEKQQLILDQIYFKNNSLTDVAESCNISVPAVTGMVTRVLDKYKLSWPVFVRKEGQKVIYNVPEILK